MSFTPSPVVTEITRQLNVLRAIPRGARLVQLNENALRVSKTTGKKTRNVDIAYNPGSDLYDVTIHAIVMPGREALLTGNFAPVITSHAVDGIYADQLADAVLIWKAQAAA